MIFRNSAIRLLSVSIAATTSLVGGIKPTQAQPPLEVYGNLPSIKSMAIAPDGKRLGFISNQEEGESFLLFDLDERQVMGGVRTDNVKSRYVSFAGPDYAILHASQTVNPYAIRGKLEYSAAYSYNLKSKKINRLLEGSDDLYLYQSGLGRIIGLHEDGKQVFMPAYVYSNPVHAVMRVNLETGRGIVHKRGNKNTIDWIVDTDGTVLAREDYDNKKNIYTIHANKDGKLEEIYRITDAKIPPMSLVGAKSDRSGLIVIYDDTQTNANLIAELSFDGKLSDPIFKRKGADASSLTDRNRFVIGAKYSGLYPTYEFFDDSLTELMKTLKDTFSPAAVTLEDWSTDYNEILIKIEGSDHAPAYYIYDRTTNGITRIASNINGLTNEDMADVLTIEYKARDGVRIPSVLTRPRAWQDGQKYPTIIMPHGGPESYDKVGYDWMAQYFASRGYLVLQPNFRGSDGLGTDYLLAGRGEWGRGIMQHDVTDGLKALIKTGWADPERVCIIGGSYGGYAALAGGAFTPDLYSCVAAIAPVTDLPKTIIEEKRDNGKDSWVVTYWSALIGDLKEEREKLKSISPSEYASEFKAPVLLIHGKDDTIVPIRQSIIMERALKRAGKDVEFIKLKGEDHYLSGSETRLATLKALDGFVKKSIGEGITSK